MKIMNTIKNDGMIIGQKLLKDCGKMNNNIPPPSEYGLPHPDWRPVQWDAYQNTSAMYNNGGGIAFAQVATGGGKTGIACALGYDGPVLYVAATLALLDQSEKYGFVPIKGRQAYPCTLPAKVAAFAEDGMIATALDCHYGKMSDCPAKSDCPYLIQKVKAINARRTACTYKYLGLSYLMQQRGGIIVLDECHNTVQEMMAFSEFVMNEHIRNKWKLPRFPYYVRPYGNGKGDVMSEEARETVDEWVVKCIQSLNLHSGANTTEGVQAKRLQQRLERLTEELNMSQWFLESGRNVIELYTARGKRKSDGIRLRALDARAVAQRLTRNKKLAVFMSATIGTTPEPIADQLAIDDYEFFTYDHPVPAEYRPVKDLGFPRMTYGNLKNNPDLYAIQAIVIKNWINEYPQDWRGIVLTSSNYKVRQLREGLAQWLPGRIFVPKERAGTAERAAQFISDKRKGIILVDTIQGLGSGLDLYGDAGRFAVVAGVPFQSPTDPFVQARRKFAKADSFMWHEAYSSVFQAVGRVSRAEQDENGEWLLNVAALADGSATSPRARKHYPSWFEVT